MDVPAFVWSGLFAQRWSGGVAGPLFLGKKLVAPQLLFLGDAPAHVGHRRWIFCGSAEIFPLTTRLQSAILFVTQLHTSLSREAEGQAL